jgi:hypothetical protein
MVPHTQLPPFEGGQLLLTSDGPRDAFTLGD